MPPSSPSGTPTTGMCLACACLGCAGSIILRMCLALASEPPAAAAATRRRVYTRTSWAAPYSAAPLPGDKALADVDHMADGTAIAVGADKLVYFKSSAFAGAEYTPMVGGCLLPAACCLLPAACCLLPHAEGLWPFSTGSRLALRLCL